MPRKRGVLSQQIASLLDPTPQEIIPEEEWEEPQVDTEISGDEDEAETPEKGRLQMRSDISLTLGKYKGVPSSREKHGLGVESEESDDDQSISSDDQSDEMDIESDQEEISRAVQSIVRIINYIMLI